MLGECLRGGCFHLDDKDLIGCFLCRLGKALDYGKNKANVTTPKAFASVLGDMEEISCGEKGWIA